MTRKPDVSLVLPCFNEEKILEDSVQWITASLRISRFSFEIIFVDDKSHDRTTEVIKKICRKYPNCRAIFHRENQGRGQTVADGILSANGQIAGYIDADLEVSPVYIPEMVRLLITGKADMIIGKRIYRTSFASIPREILSVGYRRLVNGLLDTKGYDTETGYKFFNRKKILPVIKQTVSPHWFWDTEIIVRANRKGLKVTELPVLYIRRFDKKSSVRIVPDTVDYLINLWKFRGMMAKNGIQI